MCPSGEIGIHVCLRSICRKACWFKSSLGHHYFEKPVGAFLVKWCDFTMSLDPILAHRNKSMGVFACPLAADKAQNTECYVDNHSISDCILGFSDGAARTPALADENT